MKTHINTKFGSYIVLFCLLGLFGCSNDDPIKDYVEPGQHENADPENPPMGEHSNNVYVDFDNDIEGHSFNLDNGELTMTFKNEVANFIGGVSTIVVPTDSTHYIRIVDSVQKSGKTIKLQTHEGTMSDLFWDTEFELSFDPNAETKTGKSNVYYPERIFTHDKNGEVKVYYDANDDQLTKGGDNLTFKGCLFKHTFDYNGKQLFSHDGVEITANRAELKCDLNAVIHFSFGKKIENYTEKIQVPKGVLNEFFYYLKGTVDGDLLLQMTAESKRKDHLEQTLQEKILGPTGLTFKFMVGTVPVFITLQVDLESEETYDFSAEGKVIAGINAGYSIKSGMSFIPDMDPQPIFEADKYFIPYKPEILAKINCFSEFSFYPSLNIMFYNFVGTDIDIKPFIGSRLSIGTHLGVPDEYVGWQGELFTRMDVKASLLLNFLGKTLHETKKYQLNQSENTPLIITPMKVYAYPESVKHQIIKNNNPVEISARVEDFVFNDMFTSYTPFFPVEFQATNAKVNEQFVFTDTLGVAKTTIEPIDKDQPIEVTIQVKDGNGETISSDKFILTPENNNSIIGTWDYCSYDILSLPEVKQSQIERIIFKEDSTFTVYKNMTKVFGSKPFTSWNWGYVDGKFSISEEGIITMTSTKYINRSLPENKDVPLDMDGNLSNGIDYLVPFINKHIYSFSIQNATNRHPYTSMPNGIQELNILIDEERHGAFNWFRRSGDTSDKGTKPDEMLYPYIFPWGIFPTLIND